MRTHIIVGIIGLLLLSCAGCVVYVKTEEFKQDLKLCHEAGYEGIYWKDNLGFYWECYKYD